MFKNKSNRGTEAFKLLSFALLTIYFVGITLFDGPIWCVDTPSYVDMDFSREPVYPLFLMALRRLLEAFHVMAQPYGLPAYLTLAVILQSFLWVVSSCHLGFFILNRTCALGEKKSQLLSTIAMLGQAGVAGINRFVAGRGSMYSESLMTEALAMPLYVIFTVELIKSIDEYDQKKILKLFFLSALMGSIRKQMLIVLITWGFASFILHLFVKRHRSIKSFSLTVIAVVLAFMAITLVDRGYNLAMRGVFVSHIGNSKGGLNTLIYTALPEDSQVFIGLDENEYPEMETLFTRIYDECRAQKLTIDYAPGYELVEKSNIFNSDWAAMASHYADVYDVIGFDVVLPICDEYVAEHYPGLDRTHAQIKENQIENLLFGKLLSHTLSKIVRGEDRGAVYVLTANILKAFVISNANISPSVLIKVSLIIYVIYLAVFIALFIREKTSQRALVARMMFIVLAGIAINCVVTGSMIFPQPRYMCYGMGLFYLALVCGILI